MSSSRRVVWALWGALAAVAVIILAVLVGASQSPALGDPLDVGEPLPAVSLTGPVPSPTPTSTGETTAQPSPTQTTEIVVPDAPETVPMPSASDDDDHDDDDHPDDD